MLLADRVIFIDAEAIVVDKPAGLPVDVPRDGALSVESHLDLLRFGFERRPMSVHRLDRDTSGCLLLARNPRAHKRFAAAFEAGTVAKTYLAIVAGIPEAASGTVELALAKVSTRETGWRMVASAKGRAARTDWVCMATGEGQALLRLAPATGRTHQLRVHAASGIGHAIVGDPVYGASAPHMLLHATAIRLERPGKAAIAAAAPLPEHFPAWARDAAG